MNDSGQVVGWSEGADNQPHAFLSSASEGMVDLGTMPSGVDGAAVAVNDNGQVAGWSSTTQNTYAVLWQPLQPPSITSTCPSTASVGDDYACSVTTTGYPTSSLTESGTLPSGVTFVDNGNGTATLSGTPTAGSDGSYTPQVTASNGVSPDAVQAIDLTIDQSPAITTASPPLIVIGGQPYSYDFAASGSGGDVRPGSRGPGMAFRQRLHWRGVGDGADRHFLVQLQHHGR